MSIYSLQVEQHSLSGLLKFPSIFSEIDSWVAPTDYYNQCHETLFSVIRQSYLKNETLDKIILAQKVKNLGITFKDDIDIFDYIKTLYFTQITKDASVCAFKELVKLRVRREMCLTARSINDFVKANGELPLDKIIAESDKIYNDKISSLGMSQSPVDLFAEIEQLIDARGNNPVEIMGLRTPYVLFNKIYGGLRKGNVYAWVSRAKHGKSNLLADIAYKGSLMNQCKTLYLDTEMTVSEVQFRLAAAVTGIPVYHLETGQFNKNKELVDKFNSKRGDIKKYIGLVDHMNVAGKPTAEIASIIRRWYYKNVGRGNNAMVIYDYLKLTGEEDDSHGSKKEYQLIGEKVNTFKELSLELDVPFLTACQLNRKGEENVDDSSAIAQSDRLLWFASFVAIFRRKSLAEMAEHGLGFGSHMMIPLGTRFQGEEAGGHHDVIKVPVGANKFKYCNNFLNFNINNFDITERGTLKDIVAANGHHHAPVQLPNPATNI